MGKGISGRGCLTTVDPAGAGFFSPPHSIRNCLGILSPFLRLLADRSM